MKKYLLPILIAGAGAVIFFTMKGKGKNNEVTKANIDENEEIKSTPKKPTTKNNLNSKLKNLNVNSIINKVSKGAAIISKFSKKKKANKKTNTNSIPSPYQPKAKAPIKFY